jgi:hypothetical protein
MGTKLKHASGWWKYSYLWATLFLFLFSLAGHWVFGWYAFVEEAQTHSERPEVSAYTIEMFRDTFENWQSEFLQLIWQVGGLAYLFYIGSPSSKEGDDRKEEKLDFILRAVDREGEVRIRELDEKYARDN